MDAVDALLAKLADDDSLHDALGRASVQKALRHWTNEKRLSPEEAEDLFDEDDSEFRLYIRPVLEQLKPLQHACKDSTCAVCTKVSCSSSCAHRRAGLASCRSHARIAVHAMRCLRLLGWEACRCTSSRSAPGASRTPRLRLRKRGLMLLPKAAWTTWSSRRR
mmetsp:Transcript_58715/g.182389  ORF Transcript_58715/g.182389 Transcript_58715/m.182389 type:complete len:163 (-) Transcript_58715:282-770(-)